MRTPSAIKFRKHTYTQLRKIARLSNQNNFQLSARLQ